MRQSAKINIFSATVNTIWKSWRATYSECFGIFWLYTSHVSTVHSECNFVCQEVRKYLEITFTFRKWRPLNTRQCTRVEFPRSRICWAARSVACRRPPSSAHGNMQTHLAVYLSGSLRWPPRIVAQVDRELRENGHFC